MSLMFYRIPVIMKNKINQAVVLTKPLHHMGLALTPNQLDEEIRSFLVKKGFNIVFSKMVTGVELAERNVIGQQYQMYSKASSMADELVLSDTAQSQFEAAFGQRWNDEVAAGKILGNPQLQESKGITANDLNLIWSVKFARGQTRKIQDGLLMTFLEDFDSYVINGFYPAMEENFYNPKTEISYHVLEFDPDQVSWEQFRKKILGATDARKSEPDSFRGQLYARFSTALEYPGGDNFVHGSAGPIEGLIERIIHEPNFDLATNPVGCDLLKRGITLETFNNWTSTQSIIQLSELFDSTKEKNTTEALYALDAISF